MFKNFEYGRNPNHLDIKRKDLYLDTLAETRFSNNPDDVIYYINMPAWLHVQVQIKLKDDNP